MTIATLSAIITKFRKLTQTTNSYQITDSDIKDYINSFYLYDFPAQFRSLKLKDKLTFDTVYGIDTYPFDSENYTTIQEPCYCDKREIKLFQGDPWSFYGVNFNWQQIEQFDSGDGGPTYTGNTQNTPLLRSVNNNPNNINYPVSRVQNILITANSALGSTFNVTDDGNGNLVGDVAAGTNTIDYATGAINVTFSGSVPNGNEVNIKYNPIQPTNPLSILFFQNQFTLRPVPDAGYTIELVAYRQPSQALMNTPSNLGTPELNEWWELIAVGAAKKYYEDQLDMDGMAFIEKLLMEKYMLANTRTYAQMGKQQIQTIYSDQLTHNYGAGYGPFGMGGNV